MDINKIGKKIYKESDVHKKEEMDEVYYRMADFLKEHAKSQYDKFLEEAEDIMFEIEPEKAKQIVIAMKPFGQRWSMEEIKEYLKSRGISEKIKYYYMVMNMMYNDYARTAKQYNLDVPEFYFDLSFDFINDVDAKRHKIEKYFVEIV